MIYSTLFNVLNNNIGTIGANTVSSGNTLESTKRPLVYIEQLSRSISERNTCLQRQEEVLFQIHAVSLSFSELNSLLSGIESTLDWVNLNESYDNANRTMLAVEWQGRERFETRPGRFQGSINYLITVETSIGSRLKTDTTSGSNFYKNLRDRYIAHTQLSDLVNDFTSGEFVLESSKRPFIFTEGFSTEELESNTKNRQELERFSLVVDEFKPQTVENILEEIMNVYDYCKITSSNRIFLNLEWVGSELFEMENNLWRGKINYELTQEKVLS